MSNNDYGVVEVIYKPTGEKRLIKWDRFNPNLHKQIGEVRSKEYALVYGQPVHTQTDGVGIALASAKKKAEDSAVELAAKVEAAQEISLATTPEVIDNEEVEPDYASMKMPEVRKLAKEKGIQFIPTDKKVDLVAKIKDTNVSNP